MRITMIPRVGQPSDLLDLPWQLPLEEWRCDRLVEVPRGIGRHVVRFVSYGKVLYALKELPRPLAEREYGLLRGLKASGVPAVAPAALVTGRLAPDGEPLESVIVTRHLDFALPYRLVLARRVAPDLWSSLLDAFAELLVRLHLAGFFWGDCSLSNVLFRRDAGALCAYLVDAETGARYEELSDGQRRHDLDIAEENLLGELCDLAAETGAEAADPLALAEDVRERYERLWAAVTGEELVLDPAAYRVEERIRRLNDLGFDVDEVELVAAGDAGYRLRLRSRVVEPGHHRRRLVRLTGLEAQENQARRLLNDMAAFRNALEAAGEPPVSETDAAARWLHEAFEPAIAAIPEDLHGKRAPAQLFHEVLDHRWFLSEAAGRDVGLMTAVCSYVDNVLRALPDERTPTDAGDLEISLTAAP